MYLGKIFQANEWRNKDDYYWELIFTDHFLRTRKCAAITGS